MFDFFAYVAEIVFIEVATFQRNGIFCLRIVVDIVSREIHNDTQKSYTKEDKSIHLLPNLWKLVSGVM